MPAKRVEYSPCTTQDFADCPRTQVLSDMGALADIEGWNDDVNILTAACAAFVLTARCLPRRARAHAHAHAHALLRARSLSFSRLGPVLCLHLLLPSPPVHWPRTCLSAYVRVAVVGTTQFGLTLYLGCRRTKRKRRESLGSIEHTPP